MSVLDLASGVTSMKRTGRQWVGRCPLHQGDDTPSFTVDPEKDVWICFGCGAGGSYRALYEALHGTPPPGQAPRLRRPKPPPPPREVTPWGAVVPNARQAIRELLATVPAGAGDLREAEARARFLGEGR